MDTTPGQQFRYSGGGTTIAHQAVIDVLNQSFPQIMKELILNPFELNNSTYEQPITGSLRDKVVCAHNENGTMVEGGHHVYPEMAAAGLWTTPSDLARLGSELQLILKGEGNNLLTKKSLEEMLIPQADGPVGIGFFIEGLEKNVIFSHNGCNTGFESRMKFYKEGGKGFVIMINSQECELIDEIERAIAYTYNWTDLIPMRKKHAQE